jgi:quercetin dioxygenase-like cupin family protein
MAGLAVVARSDAPTLEQPSATVHITSDAVSVRQLSPEGISLWLHEVAMLSGGEMRWDIDHGDEALYVLDGTLEVCSDEFPRPVPAGGAVIIESAVAAHVVAGGPVRFLQMGPSETSAPSDGPLGPAEPDGHSVHAVGPRGVFARIEPGRETRFYADSSCPTCRITLMQTGRTQRYHSEAHSHSQDELIHLLTGEITVGREVLGPGDTLYVAANRRYTFTSGDEGFSFLNYRRDASMHTIVRGGEPVLEGGAAHGFPYVGDLR